mmetsp:Transcript_7117/g.20959  ORF Transcript_7117/g.20959 Transcript_7117/m.20959 type:complete len:227 (+) Transcript_7117:1547-2227(+)
MRLVRMRAKATWCLLAAEKRKCAATGRITGAAAVVYALLRMANTSWTPRCVRDISPKMRRCAESRWGQPAAQRVMARPSRAGKRFCACTGRMAGAPGDQTAASLTARMSSARGPASRGRARPTARRRGGQSQSPLSRRRATLGLRGRRARSSGSCRRSRGRRRARRATRTALRPRPAERGRATRPRRAQEARAGRGLPATRGSRSRRPSCWRRTACRTSRTRTAWA